MSVIWIKLPDWLKIRNGCGILIYSAGQGLISRRLGKVVLLKCFGEYNTESTMIGVAPYDKNHTENIDSRKIGITGGFFVLNMRYQYFFSAG